MLSNDISDLVRQLRERGAKSVALQFPAGLKRRAAGYATALEDAGFDVIISGDPCYGACDLALDTLALPTCSSMWAMHRSISRNGSSSCRTRWTSM